MGISHFETLFGQCAGLPVHLTGGGSVIRARKRIARTLSWRGSVVRARKRIARTRSACDGAICICARLNVVLGSVCIDCAERHSPDNLLIRTVDLVDSCLVSVIAWRREVAGKVPKVLAVSEPSIAVRVRTGTPGPASLIQAALRKLVSPPWTVSPRTYSSRIDVLVVDL